MIIEVKPRGGGRGDLSPTPRVGDCVLRPPHEETAVHVVEPELSQSPLLVNFVRAVEVQVPGLVQRVDEVPLRLARQAYILRSVLRNKSMRI